MDRIGPLSSSPSRPGPVVRVRRIELQLRLTLIVTLSFAFAGCGAPAPSGPAASGPPSPPSSSGAPPTVEPSVPPAGPIETPPILTAPHPVLAIPRTISLYPGRPSVLPGQPLELHVSTDALRYDLAIYRVGAGGLDERQPVWTRLGLPGRAVWDRVETDPATLTTRAEWPVSVSVDTSGWAPGVYAVRAGDSRRGVGWTLFVVRSPSFSPDRPAFVLPVMTYEAYNSWGAGDFYSRPRTVQVSFARPYLSDGGRSVFRRSDVHLIAWLARHGYPLDYTTDYDLALDPPSSAPGLLIVPMHMEYVPATLRDWIELHVNTIGDMNLALFGANSIYWQARLVPAPHPGDPAELVCYKSQNDPITATDPAAATVRWRDPPVDRPEGAIFGSQYVGILGDGHFDRYDFTVDPAAPPDLLAGTGWTAGTRIRGLLVGEGDALVPNVGATPVLDGHGADRHGRPLSTTVVVRVSPAGARVFSVGTFQWTDGFIAAAIELDLGVSPASFDRFNRNVLAWLGFPAPH